MMVRSSCGRFSCIRFIRSRNLVRVRAVVAMCWRKVAMYDYILRRKPIPRGRAQLKSGKCSADDEETKNFIRLGMQISGFKDVECFEIPDPAWCCEPKLIK